MPEKLEECVDSVLADNPGYSESRAYAICNAQRNESELSEGVTPEDVGRIAAAHNIAPECAITLANGKELDEDDPCWSGYTMVGMKPGPGGEEVPNCVPDDDVPDADLSAPRTLAEFQEGEAVMWDWQGSTVHGRVREVREEQATVGDDVTITGGDDDDEAVYIIDEYDEERDGFERANVAKPESSLNESTRDLPDRTDDNMLARGRVLASRRLAGPIEREEQDGAVVYKNLKILSEGAWTDSESREELYYDPANLEVVEGATVNVMHDDNNDVSEVGTLLADSAYVENGDLYADVQLHLDNAASEYADENLQKTLESEGRVGFGGPSVEIPADGQEIDTTTKPPELEDGKISGLAFVSQPAARTTAFAQQVQERQVALADGSSHKSVYVESDDMSRKLMDVDELRETLDMFGFDGLDEMTDDEVGEMAEDLHADLMEQLQEESDMEAADGDEGDMAMGDMMQELEEMQQELQELRDKEEEMEQEMMEMKEHMDMSYHSSAEELEAALREAKEDLEKRLAQLEEEPKEPRTMADSDEEADWSDADSGYRYSSGTNSLSR